MDLHTSGRTIPVWSYLSGTWTALLLRYGVLRGHSGSIRGHAAGHMKYVSLRAVLLRSRGTVRIALKIDEGMSPSIEL